jgi:Arc/MetJ-type ribon-helix-helix transcriptional regulator
MSKTKGSMKRYSISLTKKNISQLDSLQAELGFASISETVRGAIHALHSKTFPSYAQGPRRLTEYEEDGEAIPAKPRLTKEQIKEQKLQNEIATCVAICETELNGLVSEDEDGNPQTCAYFQYDRTRRFPQEIDILSVNKGLVEAQYNPNKEYVEKLQKDGNVEYDPNEVIDDVVAED